MPGIIGTAGHVDHGKSSLILALTSIDPDRLPDEKRRGMTIDLGFAYLVGPNGEQVSIVDVPGHESLVSNMLAGVLGVQLVVLCIAADDGVMAQTREHLAIITHLPISHLVVALTKSDLVTPADIDLREQEIREELAATRFGSSPVVRVSVRTGNGLDELKTLLLDTVSLVATPQDEASRIWVDRSFHQPGRGTVVTGSLLGGTLRVGDNLEAHPGGHKLRATSLQVHGQDCPTVVGPERVAILLGGAVKPESMGRGTLLTVPGAAVTTSAVVSQCSPAIVATLPKRVRVAIGTEEVLANVRTSPKNPTKVFLALDREVGAYVGAPILLRRHSPMDVLGGGTIEIVRAKPSDLGEKPTLSVLGLIEDAPTGITSETICRRLGQTPQALGNEFERLRKEQKVISLAGVWFSVQHFRAMQDRFLRELTALHEKAPTYPGVQREAALKAAGISLDPKPAERFLTALQQSGRIVERGKLIAASDFRMKLNPRQTELVGKICAAIDAAGINAPLPHELARSLNVPIQAINEGLELAISSGFARRVDADLVYPLTTIRRLISELRKGIAGAEFRASEARDLWGTSRRFVIPMLEFLDQQRVTVRDGETRRFVKEERGPDGTPQS